MKCRRKPDTSYMNYSEQYHVFAATFHVISRKVDYLWDSASRAAIDAVNLHKYGNLCF